MKLSGIYGRIVENAEKNKIKHKFVGGEELKHCSCCKKWVNVKLFGKDNTRWDKLQKHCKPCRKKVKTKYNPEQKREYYQQNRDKILTKAVKHNKNYRKRNKEALSIKAKADWKKRYKGNVWKLTPSEIYKFSGFVLVETSDDCVLPRGK